MLAQCRVSGLTDLRKDLLRAPQAQSCWISVGIWNFAQPFKIVP